MYGTRVFSTSLFLSLIKSPTKEFIYNVFISGSVFSELLFLLYFIIVFKTTIVYTLTVFIVGTKMTDSSLSYSFFVPPTIITYE